jgi:SM-20-related protein
MTIRFGYARIMRADSPSSKPIADAIEQSGYAVVQSFIDSTAISALAQDCRDDDANGKLSSAAIGHGDARRMRNDIRGDRTRWFDETESTPAQSNYWAAMHALRLQLNRSLMLGLDELEAHYALYAPGARYARHRDTFRDDDARVLSSVLYLNADWRDDDGGALRLYLSDSVEKYLDIYPRAGTLVLFLSADLDHEVLPATRDRLSIAGWFRRRA